MITHKIIGFPIFAGVMIPVAVMFLVLIALIRKKHAGVAAEYKLS